MNDLVVLSVSTRRVTFVLLAIFSGLALALAAVGIYGVMSYAVAQRTHELGIRLALGAQQSSLLATVIGQGFVAAGAGIAIGIALAVGLTRVMSNLLFSVSATDPTTLATVGVGMAIVALVACAIPGWRALRVSPLIALRRE